MKNKKTIMAFSGIQILVFHLWVYVFASGLGQVEKFLKINASLGVDIFFFLSAYSLANRSLDSYASFVFSRFKAVYAKFIAFAIIASIYVGWKLKLLLEVVTTVNLFKRGGGAFLWFLPAIMILYILFPLFKKCDEKNRWLTLALVIVGWFGLGLIGTWMTGFKHLFIFWNRLPVFLLGYYMAKCEPFKKLLLNKKLRVVVGIVLTVVGNVLISLFAYKSKLSIPLHDMFYLIYIPASIGLILLVGLVPDVKPIKWIGSSTLEMYAIQMIWGYKVTNMALKITGNAILTNLVAISFVIITAVIVHYAVDFIILKANDYTSVR